MLEILETIAQLQWAQTQQLPEYKCGDIPAKSGSLVSAAMLPYVEPALDTRLLGAIFYPDCAAAHPVKVLRAIKEQAVAAGVVVVEHTSVQTICLNDATGRWTVSALTLKARHALAAGATGSSSVAENQAAIHQKQREKGICSELAVCVEAHSEGTVCIGEQTENAASSSCELSVCCDNVVIACGSLSSAVAQLVSCERATNTAAESSIASLLPPAGTLLRVAVIPVIGQMFRTEACRDTTLRHIICGGESAAFWDQNSPTSPPCITHQRAASGHGWERQLTRHLYGRQITGDQKLIFGGDRRVHPPQHLGPAHGLPRILNDAHDACIEHVKTVVPVVNKLAVEYKWSGVMPFSKDGFPIIGQMAVGSNGSKTVRQVPGVRLFLSVSLSKLVCSLLFRVLSL